MVDEEVVRRPKKKQFLGVFNKRQSRIEPENVVEMHEPQSPRIFDAKIFTTPSKAIIKSPLNRFSGNFSFCCSASAASTLSPNDIEDIPIVKPIIRPRDHLKLDLNLLNPANPSFLDNEASNNATFKIISNISYQQLELLEQDRVEINLQKPITESKSRFRNRYPPPSSTYISLNKFTSQERLTNGASVRFERCDQPLQHFSNPDLVRKSPDRPRERK